MSGRTEGPFLLRLQVLEEGANHLEFVGTAEEMKDLPTALRLIETAGADNGGLLVDTLHFHLGGSKPSDLDGVLDQAADAVEAFLADGAERAMNRFNAAPARVAPSQPQRTAAPRLEET